MAEIIETTVSVHAEIKPYIADPPPVCVWQLQETSMNKVASTFLKSLLFTPLLMQKCISKQNII